MPGSNDSSAFVLATVSTLLFFLSILLHELGHAVVAIRNGISIAGIDLWLFGGVAKMSRDTQSPGVEFRVPAAGPLVTLVIAIVCAGLGVLVAGSLDDFGNSAAFDAGGDGGRPRRDARVPGEHQHRAAPLQPDPGVPPRRRAHRPGDHLEGHRRPDERHQQRRAAGSGLLLHPDRRRYRRAARRRAPVLGRRLRLRPVADLHRHVPGTGGALGDYQNAVLSASRESRCRT